MDLQIYKPNIRVITTTDEQEIKGRIDAGVDIFNVAGADKTPCIIEAIRNISPDIAIIATGGRKEETIQKAIDAGANAISYTPPSTEVLFRRIMEKYREVEEES